MAESGLRARLREVLEESRTPSGRILDYTIQGLIVLSLVTFSIETLPDLSRDTQEVLAFIEIGTVVVFSVEYLLRCVAAKRPIRFVLSFFGLVDLIAILPFYLAAGVDLRSLRVFRLLRLVRVLKLVRYSEAVRRFHRALSLAKEELVLFFAATAMILYLSAVGIYFCENAAQPKAFASVFHSLWWAVATLTTVGYGDVYPVTTAGRLFTFMVLLVGLGIVAVPAGLLSSALSKARELEAD